MTDELEQSVSAYRREVRPSAMRSASIEAAVLGSVPVAAPASALTNVLGVAVGVGLGALVVAGILATRPTPGPANEPPVVESSTDPRSPGPPSPQAPVPPRVSPELGAVAPAGNDVAEPALAPSPQPTPARVQPRSVAEPKARPASPTAPAALEDMRMLRDAERKIERDPSGSLALLRSHASRYPTSPLSLERSALRVVALCAAGRLAEGRTAREQFLAAHPGSAYERRVQAACQAAE